jgi:hypothetical protein
MTYEDWLWLKLLGVAVGFFVYRLVIGLRAPGQSDNRSEPPRR